MDTRPNEGEVAFLTLAYNRFYDLQEAIMDDSFWDSEPSLRFLKIKDLFSVYGELLNYEPIGWYLEHLMVARPAMESELAKDLFKFIRNVIAHFPLFDTWNEVWINRQLANWIKSGQTIDKFLRGYAGSSEVKYRFWEPEKKRMTYLSIKFPASADVDRVFLKDILEEQAGVKFAIILMRQVLDSQVEGATSTRPVLMAAVGNRRAQH